jgi:hypothetical protein
MGRDAPIGLSVTTAPRCPARLATCGCRVTCQDGCPVIEEASVPTDDRANVDATDVDPAGVASLVNAIFEDRIPVIRRLGIRIVEARDGFVAGEATATRRTDLIRRLG